MEPSARRAAVVTPFFSDRDAVSNDVFQSVQALRSLGWEAAIFAVGGTSERAEVLSFERLARFIRSPSDLLYYHFSTGRRELTDAIARLACRKILKFHNITPPELFSMWSDELAEASRVGREELRHVAAMPWERVWAASAFNLADLVPWLDPSVPRGVLAPFHETAALLAERPPSASPSTSAPRILTVGRIAQSKGHPFLLRVMRYLVHELRVPAMLDIVGKPDHRLVAYLRNLELIIREYGLESHVTLHGEIGNRALAERYATASVFLMTSEHEGFCVPLIEAMAFGVPIVALATSAIPETVAGAGLVWEERDPRRFALSIAELLRDPAQRAVLAQAGRERYREHFEPARLVERFAAALGEPAREPA